MGKMLIYAAILGCLTPVAIIAAAMTARSPFVSPLDKRQEADAVKIAAFGGAKSDALAVLAAYKGWEASKAAGGWAADRKYCSDMFLSGRALANIQEMAGQFRRLLREAGFVGGGGAGWRGVAAGRGAGPEGQEQGREVKADPCDAHADNMLLVRAVLVAGLYPNVVRVESKAGGGGAGGSASASAKPPKLVAQVQLANGKAEERGVQIHPCSVNWGVTHFESPWLVYSEMVESSAVYLRDCTMVTPYPLLLFGGPISVQLGGVAAAGVGGAGGCVCVGDWVRLGCAPRVGVLFKELRAQLDAVLQVGVG